MAAQDYETGLARNPANHQPLTPLLFLERAEAAGKDAAPLQMRRLGWLMLFGYLHFALIWWGDILFTYAVCGFTALAFRFVSSRWRYQSLARRCSRVNIWRMAGSWTVLPL